MAVLAENEEHRVGEGVQGEARSVLGAGSGL